MPCDLNNAFKELKIKLAMKTVTPHDLARIVKGMAIEGGFPVMIWGAPGIGKSEIVKQVVKELGLGLLDMRLNYYEESDLLGIPVKTEDGMRFMKYTSFPREGKGLWFFDELTHARTSVQGLVFELINDGKIEDYRVPEGWRHFVGASNLPQHRSISNPMPTGLASRFTGGHYELVPDLMDWVAWANGNGIDERVISFVSFMENSDSIPWLLRMDGEFPLTPRTWSRGVSYAVSRFSGKDLENILGGLIGEENSAEFLSFLNGTAEFPGFADIVRDPGKWLSKDQDPSRKYLFLNSIVKNTANGNIPIDKTLTIISALDHEYIAFALTALSRSVGDDTLLASRVFIENTELFSEVLGSGIEHS